MSEGKTPQRTRVDAALAAWPEPERSAADWDASAQAVMARLEPGVAGDGDVSDEDLLAAPLPASREEVQVSAASGKGEASSMNTSSRQRDRASLKELAKMADMPPPSSQPPSSGMFAEARRASQPPAPVEGEREENSGLIRLGAIAEGESGAKQAAVAAAPAGPAAAAAPVAQATTASKAPARRDVSGLRWIGGMVAAAAVAAGVFVGVRGTAKDGASPVAAIAPPPGAAQPGAGAVNPPGKPVVTPIAAADKGIDPMSLPAVGAPGAGPAASPGSPLATGGPQAPRPSVAAASASPVALATATAAPDPRLVAVIPSATAAPSAGSDASLHDLMQQAAGVTPSTPTVTTPDAPPATAPGSVPFRPSMGAINGALGAALPAARACLGPDDPISRATVVFQSDGSVQSVSISGGAAGKPAEGCIRAALMKARVQPFAVPTFSAPTTIRSN